MAFQLDNLVNEQTYEKDFDTVASQPHQGHPTPIKQPLDVEMFTQIDLAEVVDGEVPITTTWTWPLVWDFLREKIDDVIVFCTIDMDFTDIAVSLGIRAVAPAPALNYTDYFFKSGGQVDGAGSTNVARIAALNAGETLSFTNKTLAPNDDADATGIGGTANQIVEGPAMLTLTATPGQQASVRGGKFFIGIRKHVCGNVASADRAQKYPALTNEDGTTLL